MSDKARFQDEGMTVADFASVWVVPPWKADCRLRKLVKDGIMKRGTMTKELKDSEGDVYTREVEVFILSL